MVTSTSPHPPELTRPPSSFLAHVPQCAVLCVGSCVHIGHKHINRIQSFATRTNPSVPGLLYSLWLHKECHFGASCIYHPTTRSDFLKHLSECSLLGPDASCISVHQKTVWAFFHAGNPCATLVAAFDPKTLQLYTNAHPPPCNETCVQLVFTSTPP